MGSTFFQQEFVFFFEKTINIFIVGIKRATSLTEDTNKLIILTILGFRASLWKGQLSSLCRHDSTQNKKQQDFETMLQTMIEHVYGEEK